MEMITLQMTAIHSPKIKYATELIAVMVIKIVVSGMFSLMVAMKPFTSNRKVITDTAINMMASVPK